MVDIALFPIPSSVAFPGVPCPLHVFEPRYRKMVRHCVDRDMPMGVCHTEKVVHARESSQTREDILNSNQSTYKPRSVFSAGQVEILQELEDGRLLITMEPEGRFNLVEEKLTLPFSIWACEELIDNDVDSDDRQALEECKAKILNRLITITHGQTAIQDQLRSDYWQTMPALPFSFAIAGRLSMDAELAQHLLETTDTAYRLDTLLELLNRAA
ncbi:MAG: LON peptidase substrate-binding domain-containing protein [Pseudomonadota bacterium]